MDNKYTAGIDKFINDNRENIIRDIARLVAIDSVEGKAEPGAPFGVPLRYSIRALLGTNEETGMGDVEYYLNNYKAPVFCFSPDSGFPVCNGEKGICNLRIVSKTKLDKIADIRGGVAGNVIPGKAEAWVKGAKPASTESVSVEADGELWHLTAKGIGGHASKPEGTVNAIGVLISYILENKLAGEEEEKFLRLLMKLHESWDGSGLGVDADDGAAGAVGGHESGGHPALVALHLEAVLLQKAGDQAESPVFLQAQLGVGPDLIGHGIEFLLVLFQPPVHVCLDGSSIHSDSPFR